MLAEYHSPPQVFVHDFAISSIVESSLVTSRSNHAVESCPTKSGSTHNTETSCKIEHLFFQSCEHKDAVLGKLFFFFYCLVLHLISDGLTLSQRNKMQRIDSGSFVLSFVINLLFLCLISSKFLSIHWLFLSFIIHLINISLVCGPW